MAESYQLSQTFGMTKLLNSNLHTINFLQFNKFSLDVTISCIQKICTPMRLKFASYQVFFTWEKVAGIKIITDNQPFKHLEWPGSNFSSH